MYAAVTAAMCRCWNVLARDQLHLKKSCERHVWGNDSDPTFYLDQELHLNLMECELEVLVDLGGDSTPSDDHTDLHPSWEHFQEDLEKHREDSPCKDYTQEGTLLDEDAQLQQMQQDVEAVHHTSRDSQDDMPQ